LSAEIVGNFVMSARPWLCESKATTLACLIGTPFSSVFTSPVLNSPLWAPQASSRSVASTGTLSDHLAAGLTVYSTVSGLFEVTLQVMNWSLLIKFRSLS
jgi:hypothetical protein